MKRIVLAFVFFAITFSPASLHSEEEKPKAPDTVRVAAIDIGYIFRNYEKSKRIKKENEDSQAPFDKRAQKHQDDIAAWEKAIRAGDFANSTEARLKAKIAGAQAHLEELTADWNREFGKARDEKLVLLWKEVRDAIESYATANKIHAVLGYFDPLDEAERGQFPNLNRKMQAMDAGSVAPLYLAGRADISKAVTDLLNKRPPAKSAKTNPAGTDRVALVNIGHIFNKFKRAISLKKALEDAMEPYRLGLKTRNGRINDWEAAIRRKEFANETEEQLKKKIAATKDEIKQLSDEMQKALSKKQEESLVQLWKEMQDSIKTYADQHGIEMVLGFGDPLDKKLVDLFPNINRKMQAMDTGGSAPLFASPKLDVAAQVTALLNKQVDEKNEIIPVQATVEKPQPARPTRVSFVNVGYVFNKYSRAQAFKKQLEDLIEPFKKQVADLKADAKKWQSALDSRDFSALSEEKLQAALRKNKREYEDLITEMQGTLGKKQEDNLVQLWKEVQLANQGVATAYGFDLVIGYGDPLTNDTLNAFPNVNRKMQALDAGHTVPLFVAPIINLDEAITGTLNIWAREPDKGSRKAPPGDSR